MYIFFEFFQWYFTWLFLLFIRSEFHCCNLSLRWRNLDASVFKVAFGSPMAMPSSSTPPHCKNLENGISKNWMLLGIQTLKPSQNKKGWTFFYLHQKWCLFLQLAAVRPFLFCDELDCKIEVHVCHVYLSIFFS